ncbi:MAG TPA: ATP-binding protein [Rhizomicrobium sp.]|jgi:nitrogen fixation/metabolism regulation signal transduction histidine kinase|nr:ATP-binding protein [Rhizomicrobium sp.]
MDYSRFQAGILLRLVALLLTMGATAWIILNTGWYVTIALFAAAVGAQVVALLHFANRPGREVARFLDSVAFDDNTIAFSALSRDPALSSLGAAMTRVLDQLRTGRAQREEQAQYLQSVIAHIPVALVSVDEHGGVQLMNLAARRLFETSCTDVSQMARFGETFTTSLGSLKPGDAMIIRMERGSGALQLKAAATGLVLGGVRQRLISLQNIETELTAQELAAWQTVIRVMAHEVMNSLTPISSLAGTAGEIVTDVLAQLPPEDPLHVKLVDAQEALETMARRSEGLLHFVQNHRRITKRMVVKLDVVPVRRVFTRLQRLLAPELAARNVELTTDVVPETLEVSADIELLDQALINLLRNAMEALRDGQPGRIVLTGSLEAGGHVLLAVADNGPGIAADQREKIFVPFYTTKRQGSGVGLTLVRQIATVHGATVGISQTPGGGATISLRF